jgi:hypothetical protein
MAPPDDPQHVPDGRAGGRSYNTDAPGQERERFFVFKIEQPFLFKLGLKLFKSQLESAYSFWFYIVEDELVLAARPINADPTPTKRHHAVLERELEEPLGGAEQDRADLGVLVFEGKIGMAGLGNAEVRELSLDPNVGEAAFEKSFYLSGEF